MTATKEFAAIKESVEAIRSDATQRFPEAASFGEFKIRSSAARESGQ